MNSKLSSGFFTPQGVALENLSLEVLIDLEARTLSEIAETRPRGLWTYGSDGAGEMRREQRELLGAIRAELNTRVWRWGVGHDSGGRARMITPERECLRWDAEVAE